MKRAVILFAHGSRDPQWRAPIERLARALARKMPQRAIAIAYLENTRPDLESQVARLAARGCRLQAIVPIFLGSGRHLKVDLARKTAALRKRYPDVRITVERAIGERPRVIAALASAIAAGIPSPHGSGRRS